MDGWNWPQWNWPQWMPQFSWPYGNAYENVQNWATQRQPQMPMPWYQQIPYWGAQAGLEILNRTNPYLDPWRQRFPPYPWR